MKKCIFNGICSSVTSKQMKWKEHFNNRNNIYAFSAEKYFRIFPLHTVPSHGSLGVEMNF